MWRLCLPPLLEACSIQIKHCTRHQQGIYACHAFADVHRDLAKLCRYQVDGSIDLLSELQPGLADNYEVWVAAAYVDNSSCFFSTDVADGGEESISGDGCRASINSVMVWPADVPSPITNLPN